MAVPIGIQKPIFSISQPNRTQFLKMMVYGQPGAGKTTLAGTAQDVASMQDVLFIDAESGTLSLSDRDDIDIIRISAFPQFSRVYEFLKLHCSYRDANNIPKLEELQRSAGANPNKRYHTVVVDSLTEVQKLVMYYLTGRAVGIGTLDSIPSQPQFKEWGQSAEMIRMLIRSFRDLPMHVLFVAAEMEVENIGQNGKQLLKRPSLPGKLSNEAQGFLDMVGYLAVAHIAIEEGGTELRRRLYLVPGRTFQAKHRFAKEGVEFIDNPTMSSLLETQR